jgi:hypothetical protein
MKLGEAMRQALATRNAREFGRIADFCRHRLGWNHDKLLSEAHRVTGADPADVDALLYEADTLETQDL